MLMAANVLCYITSIAQMFYLVTVYATQSAGMPVHEHAAANARVRRDKDRAKDGESKKKKRQRDSSAQISECV